MTLAIHPVADLRAARADLLAALQGCAPSDLLTPGGDDDPWCGRDALLHMTAWLRELTVLVDDLAVYGYQRDPRLATVPWRDRTAAGVSHDPRTVRPEYAVASLVTAHARLLSLAESIDERRLWRRGPTRFGTEISGWELLLAEAAHEREHAAQLGRQAPRSEAVCPGPGVGFYLS
jgi:hypothetical protein